MVKQENVMETGTTTVGIVCKDGIVLAADKRATAGYLIANKKTEKIQKVTDNIALTMAGTVSDAQLLIKVAESELRLKRIRAGREVNVKEAANLIARLVYSNIRKFSVIPGISHFVLGGKDSKGHYLYDIYADGSIMEIDDFISSGSGSVFVFGVLESQYKKDLSVEEGVKLAVKCVNAALQRDIASGDGIDVMTVTKDGVKKVLSRELRLKIE
ncbi:proteasome subunit beta [Candidatus Woesearchaeota archaeon]|nr:proteasome subunit beta [Candidatus Woesearchaeota archaeon]